MTTRNLKNGRSATYDECALEIWKDEGRKGKPLTKEAIRKIEQRAINKFRLGLEKAGFSEQDVMEYLASLGSTVEMEVMQ